MPDQLVEFVADETDRLEGTRLTANRRSVQCGAAVLRTGDVLLLPADRFEHGPQKQLRRVRHASPLRLAHAAW
jgi:acetyl-CoA carboxylase alpha subunit